MSETTGASVLIIDDEAQIRRFLGISLRAQGYQVLEAENGAAGLETLASRGADAVILDLGLPDEDGQVILNATLSLNPDSTAARDLIPVIRSAVHAIDSSILVGGSTAVAFDTDVAADHDNRTIIPVVLVLITLILGLLLSKVRASSGSPGNQRIGTGTSGTAGGLRADLRHAVRDRQIAAGRAHGELPQAFGLAPELELERVARQYAGLEAACEAP